MRPALTIGMAHFQDFDGVYFTIQDLRLHHGADANVQFLVVDNSPDSPHGGDVRNFLGSVPNAKYVPFKEAIGTSAPRDRVFREADGQTVICMDCHVLLVEGAIQFLRNWWGGQPEDSRDMLAGPLLYDNFSVLGTQFNDQWRAEMWGTWGTAWECTCASQGVRPIDLGAAPLEFTPLELPENELCYREVLSQQVVTACPRCGGDLPALGWAAHEAHLIREGYRCLAHGDRPFEIPGMGLGFFSMRREAWVGFNAHARGFGGEELYVHAKVRAAGGRVWCHPKVAWIHRFGRPAGVPYPIGRYSKVRNYVLEFTELGRDLTPIREHWVDTQLLSEAEWDHLLADPVAHVTPPGGRVSGGCGQPRAAAAVSPRSPWPQPPDGPQNLDTLFEWAKSVPRDLEKHADKIRELASQAGHVTAFVKRREWDVWLLAGRPDDLVTYTTEPDVLHERLHEVVTKTEVSPRAPRRLKHYTVHAGADSVAVETIAETDLLVIDTVHHADRLLGELGRFAGSVRKRICLRGTQAFGEIAEGGQGPGLLAGLRRWLRENPTWSVIYHSPDQYGLSVLSRDPADKPKLPGVLTLAANFAKAVAEHVGDGLTRVQPEQLEARLQVCTLCDVRRDTRCAACGCFLEPKAIMRSSACPLGKWPDLPAAVIATDN
jgi:hypothetical protein